MVLQDTYIRKIFETSISAFEIIYFFFKSLKIISL